MDMDKYKEMSCRKSFSVRFFAYLYNHRFKVVSTNQIYQSTFTLSCRAQEEVLRSDLPDIDVLTVAQAMAVDQFYDLGVALGFTIQQLDVIEYRRFHDKEQAIYDMLVAWREKTILSFMESLESQAIDTAISGLTFEQSVGLSFLSMSILT